MFKVAVASNRKSG